MDVVVVSDLRLKSQCANPWVISSSVGSINGCKCAQWTDGLKDDEEAAEEVAAELLERIGNANYSLYISTRPGRLNHFTPAHAPHFLPLECTRS